MPLLCRNESERNTFGFAIRRTNNFPELRQFPWLTWCFSLALVIVVGELIWWCAR